MKKIKLLQLQFLLILIFPFYLSAQEIDSTGMPGDHFSLEGALELFKNADNLEAFEKSLNDEDNKVNNLDINEDGEIDYIRVEDHMEGEVHAIVLQVPVSENESQDIAVIEVERTGDDSAILQILGDETIYGEEVIVEPFEEVASSDGGGPNAHYNIARVVINVWGWSSVRFIYAPSYVVYTSPWRWSLYPKWWKPWRPHPYRWFWNHTISYRRFYRPVKVHRVVTAHKVYTPRRKVSVTVKNKTVVRSTKRTATVSTGQNKSVTARKSTSTTVSNGKKTATKSTTQQVGARTNANGDVQVGKRSKTNINAKGKKGNGVSATKTKKKTVTKNGSGKKTKTKKTKKVKKKKN